MPKQFDPQPTTAPLSGVIKTSYLYGLITAPYNAALAAYRENQKKLAIATTSTNLGYLSIAVSETVLSAARLEVWGQCLTYLNHDLEKYYANIDAAWAGKHSQHYNTVEDAVADAGSPEALNILCVLPSINNYRADTLRMLLDRQAGNHYPTISAPSRYAECYRVLTREQWAGEAQGFKEFLEVCQKVSEMLIELTVMERNAALGSPAAATYEVDRVTLVEPDVSFYLI